MLFYQLAANRGWTSWMGDVTAAFLQGDATELERELFAEPVPELRRAMQLDEGWVVQICKACYGLTNAPRKWYKKVVKDLTALGWTASKLEPCLFTRYDENGICGEILVHVDDFQIAGDTNSETFRHDFEKIKGLYRWGLWKDDVNGYTVCGVDVTRDKLGGFLLSQARYAENVQPHPHQA